jgi:DNA-binding LytR/AlgR family response regulator
MPTALIAEDETTVAKHLQERLQAAWPELRIVAVCGTVAAAVKAVDDYRPDIAFLDIRMPGGLGIDIPLAVKHRPAYVFITAYDEFAVKAFEASAIDYLLKPVSDERLSQTIQRLKERVAKNVVAPDLGAVLQQLQAALQPRQFLQWLKAGQGEVVQLVAVDEVCYFRAQDKYTKIITPLAELWIRTSLKDLVQDLDPTLFQSIHRDTIVRLPAVAQVRRDFAGRLWLKLKERTEELAVSRRHEGVFKQM